MTKRKSVFLWVMVLACISLLLFSAIAVVVMYIGQPQQDTIDQSKQLEMLYDQLTSGDVQADVASGNLVDTDTIDQIQDTTDNDQAILDSGTNL